MALTYPRRRLSSSAREALYDRCRGDNDFPICNIPGCGLPVTPGQSWVESHFPVPHALGGTEVGVAHERCNKFFAEQVEVPLIAKAKRGRRKHIGAHVTRHPLPGGRHSKMKFKVGGGAEPRGAKRMGKLTREDFARLASGLDLEAQS